MLLIPGLLSVNLKRTFAFVYISMASEGSFPLNEIRMWMETIPVNHLGFGTVPW